jgi:TonB-linked SusC/RagA family outer membrane protein
LTSSVAVLKADEIQKNTVADVSNTLSGKAAGLIVRNFNAEPGTDASTIYVRGVSTTGNNDALIVVDGIPDRDLSLIDINDIESVTVLKDASAVAPYGSRGANGVILITTKRGKEGKPTIKYTTYYGVSKPTRLPKFCSSADYARMFNEASRNEGKEEPFTVEDISKYEAGTNPDYPNTDWWDEIIQNDPLQLQHNLSLSGATDNVSYYLSLGVFRQDAYFDRANFKKYNTRANIDANVTKDIKVSLDIMGYSDNKQSPNNGGWDAMYNLLENPMRIPNTWPVKNSDGHYVKPSMTNNPVADLELGGKTVNKSNNFNGSLTFEYTPPFIKGLSLKALGVYDFGVSHKKIWQTPYSLWRMVDRANSLYEEVAATTKPSLYEYAGFSSTKQLEFHTNYKTTIAEKHNIGALYVFNRTEWNNNYIDGQRINYASASIDQLFAGPTDGQSINGSASEGARLGHVGRLTYDFMAKYMFEANFRYDGSMKFAPGKRWGFFPSFAFGWRLSEENFIKDNFKFVDNLKLRGSWGKAGNDRVDDYQYLATYAMQSTPYSLGGVPVQAAKESRLPNPDITWETATLLDVGLESSLWKRLLTFEADYFFKQTKDILRPTQKTSSIIGIALPDANIGIVENKGVEFTIGHYNHINDFNYNASFVFTYATNKAVELGEAEGTLNDPFRRQTGKPLNAFYGAISEGLFISEEEISNAPSQGGGIAPGDIKYKDFNGPDGVPDGVIDAYDVTKIGYSNVPEIIYGINLGAEYKGFDMTLNLQGATRVNYRFDSYAGYAFYNGGNIQTWQMEERWTSENNNPNARYPRLTTSPSGNNLKDSDYWLRDGTYLRLKTLQLGYTFNQSLISKLNIKGLRIYASGQNLFTWVKDDLMTFDPEAYDSRGLFYPQAKVYTLGLNLTF